MQLNANCVWLPWKSPLLSSAIHRLFEALRATTAAPTFFPEFRSFNSHLSDKGMPYPEHQDGRVDVFNPLAPPKSTDEALKVQRQPFSFTPELQVFQDGGVLMNNPTSIALHEAKKLWPGKPIDCIVSVGTGLFHHPHGVTGQFGWTDILRTIVNSATNTEGVHQTLQDLLPEKTYYRFNPVIDEIPLDEIRPEVLSALQQGARTYMERESVRANLKRLAKRLAMVTVKKSFFQRAFFSKL
uniref:PNPLA domain-containing protein n=1 Tax=Palpitomonas bilix TaxID=652834 RepID=A0A7S3G0G6_9EUKA|mmetsp:Transcript_15253/g.38492  ORF Transcript_15253/g.38492 Transcript_15253/m.38492 type:complete len:241 (+) Transcript_15253:68-790(+)